MPPTDPPDFESIIATDPPVDPDIKALLAAAVDTPRRPSLGMAVLSRLIPGVGRVHAQKEPYAEAWQAANAEALAADGPLWVALGDSMTQGIGATSIWGGWVGQLQASLRGAGRNLRVLNLSVTGARVADIVDRQLPQLRALGVTPDLITVLVGANDMIRRSRRDAAVEPFGRLLSELAALDRPTDAVTVVATLPQPMPAAQAINALIEAAAARGEIRVADMRRRDAMGGLRGTLADDHFHPNEVGYARLASLFGRAIDLGSSA